MGEAVNPSEFAEPIARTDVIGMDVVFKPGFARLSGGEEAALALGGFIQSPGGICSTRQGI